MADFYTQAQDQLNPVYQQSEQAIQAQIPAIQQLYTSLLGGLESQGKTQNQNILESAGARGVLRSSLPVDLQTTLAQTLLGERGKLGAQQAQDTAKVNESLGNLRIQKVQGIQSLADTLYQRDLKEREFQMQQQLAAQQAAQQAASSGRSGGGGGSGLKEQVAQGKAYITQQLAANSGRDGFVSRATFANALNDWQALGGNTRTFWQQYGRYTNPKTVSQYAGYKQR